MTLFKKKGHQKIWEKWLKNTSSWPQRKRLIIFPFFGPPTTKGWRPLQYRVCTMCCGHCTLYSVYTVQCTEYNLLLHCTMYSLQSAEYKVQFTVYIVQRTDYNVRCTLYTAHWAEYNLLCTLFRGQF